METHDVDGRHVCKRRQVLNIYGMKGSDYQGYLFIKQSEESTFRKLMLYFACSNSCLSFACTS